MELTIKEIRIKRDQLEMSILNSLNKFKEETGLLPTNIYLNIISTGTIEEPTRQDITGVEIKITL